jgi:hypothetical protein
VQRDEKNGRRRHWTLHAFDLEGRIAHRSQPVANNVGEQPAHKSWIGTLGAPGSFPDIGTAAMT